MDKKPLLTFPNSKEPMHQHHTQENQTQPIQDLKPSHMI